MRSSRSARARRAAAAAAACASRCVLLALAVLVAPGCGDDTSPFCDQSFLRYDNFGAPFIINWCRACHSAELPAEMRQNAPANINFDTLDEIRDWLRQIQGAAGQGSTMPPTGGPSDAERTMLVEWLRCGAP